MSTTNATTAHSLSPLQQKILEIFKAVRDILERNGLRYFAVGGTCIGAVRHQGFIPWDDDLDIMLPDRDYKRFIEIAAGELPPNLALLDSSLLRHNGSLGLKVYDTGTTFIEEHELPYPEQYKGVFIDIFPLGGAPDDERSQKRFCRRFLTLKRLDERRRLRYRDMHSLAAKLSWLAVFPLKLLPYRFWSGKIKKMTDKYPFDKCQTSAFIWDGLLPKLLMNRERVFSDYTELAFEDTAIRCAKDTHYYLSRIFGDYMQLPPEEQRQGHHALSGLVDLHTPFTYYRQHGPQNRA